MSYRNLLDKIHLTFPQPVSDAIHNSYFVHSIMRALNQVDTLKTDLPMLGEIVDGDFEKAKEATVPDNMATIEKVTEDLVRYLQGMTIFGHPRTQQNVVRPPTIPTLIGVLLASLYNPNLNWDESSRLVVLAEAEIVGITSKMIGYDPNQSSKVFTFWEEWKDHFGIRMQAPVPS